MYDELIKMLRTCSERDSCIGWKEACPYLGTGVCDNKAEKAADAIEGLAHAVAQMAEWRRHPWIPVTERLPSNGTNVLVFEFGKVEQAYITTYTADRSLCWVVINGGSYHRISDADCPIKWWMPLPQPPKEGE